MHRQLTRRESEIVILIVGGQRNKDIARELSIAENTVEQHLVHIYQKLNVQSRVELVSFYYRCLIPSQTNERS